MAAANTHIIRKQTFEAITRSKATSFELQQSLMETYYTKVLPELDLLFSRYAGPDEHLQIDRLEITLQPMPKGQVTQLLPSQMIEELDRELQGQISQKNVSLSTEQIGIRVFKEKKPQVIIHRSAPEQLLEQWFFFLRTGHLPWWSHRSANERGPLPEAELQAILRQHPEAIRYRLLPLLRDEPAVIRRLIFQFGDELLDQVIHLLAAQHPTEAPLPRPPDEFREVYYNRLIRKILEEKPVNPVSEVPPDKLSPAAEGLHLEGAGLVLLHPFLQPFFASCQLLGEDDRFRDEACREKAVHLLHYLSSGTDAPPEYELPLPKLLAGVPLDTPLARWVKLSKSEKEAAGAVLTSAIANWPALKNTDPPTFRDGFLQREGILTRIDHGWQLTVEQNAMDVLLEHLSWGMGVIRLPWMEEVVMVEWG